MGKFKRVIEPVDHLGNRYDTIHDLCDHYGIRYDNLYYRLIKRGYTLEKALTADLRYNRKGTNTVEDCTDHEGTIFTSIIEMCKHWGITTSTYYRRRANGWSKKEILETPSRYIESSYRPTRCIKCEDHLGNKFDSVKEMCEYWGVNKANYYARLSKDWSLEKTLTFKPDKYRPKKRVKDHMGNEFTSIKEMCKHWGITYTLYYGRRETGWSMKDALETPKMTNTKKHEYEGKVYDSVRDFLNDYGIIPSYYYYKKRLGFTDKEIVEDPYRLHRKLHK